LPQDACREGRQQNHEDSLEHFVIAPEYGAPKEMKEIITASASGIESRSFDTNPAKPSGLAHLFPALIIISCDRRQVSLVPGKVILVDTSQDSAPLFDKARCKEITAARSFRSSQAL
jgi:hypothetical protein